MKFFLRLIFISGFGSLTVGVFADGVAEKAASFSLAAAMFAYIPAIKVIWDWK